MIIDTKEIQKCIEYHSFKMILCAANDGIIHFEQQNGLAEINLSIITDDSLYNGMTFIDIIKSNRVHYLDYEIKVNDKIIYKYSETIHNYSMN